LEQRQGLGGIERDESLVKVSFGYPFFQFGERLDHLGRIVGRLKGEKLVMHRRPCEVFNKEIGRAHRIQLNFPPHATGMIPLDLSVSQTFSSSSKVVGAAKPYLSKMLFL
jgi:hypothetical protein